MVLLLLLLSSSLGGSKLSLKLYPFLSSSAWYRGAARSNVSLSAEMVDRRLFMPSGIFLIIPGGWLLLLFTYRGLSPGFMYGLYFPFSKFRKIE